LLVCFVLVAVAAVGLSSFFYLNQKAGFEEKMESLIVAHPQFESLALFWVAQDQGFFVQNGLNVTSTNYSTGAAALEGVLSGDADIAVGTAEFPLVGKAFQNESIRTIGSIDKIDFIYLVGRKDRGIEAVSDLAGKRVGTTIGTVSEFYLGRLLSLNGLSMQNITLVDVRTPVDWVNGVVNGTIDAVVTAQPYADLVKDGLGDNAFVWPAQSSQSQFALMISTNEWIETHPDLVDRFLKSLLQAEEFANNYPAKAKEIVRTEMNFTGEYIEEVWTRNRFGLSLDQSFVQAMEGEARWMISNNLTNATAVPNFVNFIYFDGLVSVKPESVNIIR
jgi:ABC-type nitrate/sulfonate/bicarbonate transport system substrate-binding protein